MGLFDFVKNQITTAKKTSTAGSAKAYVFNNTEHFRGFKRSSLSCHYGEAPKNAAKFVNKDVTGAIIRFQADKTTDGRPMFNVYLSNKLVGHVWDGTNTYTRLKNEWIEQVHVEVSQGPDLQLFVKLKEGAQ